MCVFGSLRCVQTVCVFGRSPPRTSPLRRCSRPYGLPYGFSVATLERPAVLALLTAPVPLLVVSAGGCDWVPHPCVCVCVCRSPSAQRRCARRAWVLHLPPAPLASCLSVHSSLIPTYGSAFAGRAGGTQHLWRCTRRALCYCALVAARGPHAHVHVCMYMMSFWFSWALPICASAGAIGVTSGMSQPSGPLTRTLAEPGDLTRRSQMTDAGFRRRPAAAAPPKWRYAPEIKISDVYVLSVNGYNLRTPPWKGGGGQRSGAQAERSGGGPHFCSAVRTPPPAAPGRPLAPIWGAIRPIWSNLR
jgi:hypothetical protein